MDKLRRQTLHAAAIAAIQASLPVCRAQASDGYADVDAVADWMGGIKAAQGTLHFSRFADRTYFLTKEIGWTRNPDQSAIIDVPTVRVPTGFVTDFASIPRIFWSILPPDGLYTFPAIVHDYLYWEQTVSREKADLIFKLSMADFRIDAISIATIYGGVRAGGWLAWKNNADLKSKGEKRCLKVLPTNSTIRWEEWKRKDGVFCS